MTEYTYKVKLAGITELDCFKEATKDEIKILVALASLDGAPISADKLSDVTGASRARVAAAIALFEESGVLLKTDDGLLAEVEYEFEPESKEDGQASSKTVAASIRENDLYEMNRELENILKKTLETREIERITSLYTKLGLSPEYILTLAAFLNDKTRVLSVEKIVREANKLVQNGADTLESLEIYISEKNEEVAGEMEMRHLFGIFGRTLTKGEREYFKKWMHEFGYSTPIIGEAYDITVNATGKLSLGYIDTILTGWHDAGCKTLEECRVKVNIRKRERANKVNNSSQKTRKSVETDTPKYADFNSEDALMRALERSYGESDGE